MLGVVPSVPCLRIRCASAFVALAAIATQAACSTPNAPAPATDAAQPAAVGTQAPSKAADADAPPPGDQTSGAPAVPAAPARADSLEMTFVGDVIFGRYREDGYDPIPEGEFDPFADIHATLASDVIVANLETPVIEEIPAKSPIGAKYRFGASRAMLALLAKEGNVVVSLANNHSFDLRQQGQRETPRIARELGMTPIGASREAPPLFVVESIEAQGWKIGFVALTTRRNAPQFADAMLLPYSDLTAIPGEIVPLLRQARADHDVLAVVIHWGNEYEEQPDVYHRKVAHALIDGGADLVIAHHPHVLQAIEHYKGKVIAYSLGNFLFENTTAIPRLTGVLRVRFAAPSCVEKATFHPAVIVRTPSKHPAPATGGLAKQVRQRVIDQARALGTEWVQRPDSEDLMLSGLAGCAG